MFIIVEDPSTFNVKVSSYKKKYTDNLSWTCLSTNTELHLGNENNTSRKPQQHAVKGITRSNAALSAPRDNGYPSVFPMIIRWI